MSLGTATTHQRSMSSTQQRDPSKAGSIPSPMGLCQRHGERHGWPESKEGGMTRGLALGLCRRVSHRAGAGAPGWLPPAADGEPGFRCSEQSAHGSRRQWPASQAWRFLLTETQASIHKVSSWHMSQTGWQVDFEHRLGEEERAATTMSRGCAQKWLLCSASLCSHGAGFVQAELSLPVRYLLSLCTVSQGAGGWGSMAQGKMGVLCTASGTAWWGEEETARF